MDKLISALRGGDVPGRNDALLEFNTLFAAYVVACTKAGAKLANVRISGDRFLGETAPAFKEQVSYIAIDAALYVYRQAGKFGSDAKALDYGKKYIDSLLAPDSKKVLSYDFPLDPYKHVPEDAAAAVVMADPLDDRHQPTDHKREVSHLPELYDYIRHIFIALKRVGQRVYEYFVAMLAANKLTRQIQDGRPISKRTDEVRDEVFALFAPAMREFVPECGGDPFEKAGFATRKQRSDWRKKCLSALGPIAHTAFEALPEKIRKIYSDLPNRVIKLLEAVTYRKENY